MICLFPFLPFTKPIFFCFLNRIVYVSDFHKNSRASNERGPSPSHFTTVTVFFDNEWINKNHLKYPFPFFKALKQKKKVKCSFTTVFQNFSEGSITNIIRNWFRTLKQIYALNNNVLSLPIRFFFLGMLIILMCPFPRWHNNKRDYENPTIHFHTAIFTL